eukprot:TRINITY_DN1889_c2_g1_i1.p1 TRINITY_DN1889_c2_g1~~TRINITY_DN1889_c2_g1_i1.p1  ORF type:complete len:735 (+),score=160.18 TRINITY_DN1889_c2_g1_i1:322-2205(+)
MATPILQEGQFCTVRNEKTGKRENIFGPAEVKLGPYENLDGDISRCPTLKQSEYCKIKNNVDGIVRVTCGPKVLRLTPLEKVVGGVRPLPCLETGEYCKIGNTETGDTRIVIGPTVCELGPHDWVSTQPRKLPVLQRGEYCKIQNLVDGSIRVVFGPCIVDLGAYEEPTADLVQRCPDLSGEEYLTVRDESTGSLSNIVGPILFMPGPFDSFKKAKKIINLQKNEYIKVVDTEGNIRVERGERRVIPDPLDVVVGNKKHEAVNVDDHHAVLYRDTVSGELRLVTEHGLFFPEAHQELISVQKKIILEKYQTVVVRDECGRFYLASGNTDLPDEERGPGPDFFIPPYHEIYTQSWSTDIRKEHETSEDVWLFDSRPSYMNYRFECRTQDNVDLIIEVTFFWGILDVNTLIQNTADAPGDICTHARSMIMAKISQIKLMDFLGNFNEVVKTACIGSEFYTERGIDLKSAEVLRFQCANEETDRILGDIIKETCDRMKYKERQRGENEVALEKLAGEIEEERRRVELVEVKKGHLKIEAKIEGEAEGAKIGEFISKLSQTPIEGSVLGEGRAMEIWTLLKGYELQNATNQVVAQSSGNMYLKATEFNLSANNHSHEPKQIEAVTRHLRSK